MTFSASTPLRQRPAYQALEQHYAAIKDQHLKDLFAGDPDRGTALTLEAEGIYLDYSKQRVTAETIGLLVELAEESGLAELRAAMFGGEHINITEDRAVLHVALRAPAGEVIETDGADVVPDVHEVLGRMRGVRRPDPLRRMEGAHRQADPQHRQHRHRRPRSRPGDGLRGAARTTASGT